jgi:hypothetical protein
MEGDEPECFLATKSREEDGTAAVKKLKRIEQYSVHCKPQAFPLRRTAHHIGQLVGNCILALPS